MARAICLKCGAEVYYRNMRGLRVADLQHWHANEYSHCNGQLRGKTAADNGQPIVRCPREHRMMAGAFRRGVWAARMGFRDDPGKNHLGGEWGDAYQSSWHAGYAAYMAAVAKASPPAPAEITCPECGEEHEADTCCTNPECDEGRRNLADDRGDRLYHEAADRAVGGY